MFHFSHSLVTSKEELQRFLSSDFSHFHMFRSHIYFYLCLRTPLTQRCLMGLPYKRETFFDNVLLTCSTNGPLTASALQKEVAVLSEMSPLPPLQPRNDFIFRVEKGL